MTDFYAGKKVIVTGGAGFVGSFLVEALLKRGAMVISIDDFSRGNNKNKAAWYHRTDASDADRLTTFFRNERPFAVFNLAAKVAGVVYNQQHQLEMFKANVDLQTAPVLAAEATDVPHFLQVSSVCVYGEDANAPAIESELGSNPVAANDGYSWSKRIGEKVVEWSRLEHAVIVRPSNIYGPRDYFDLETSHVIPALIAKCQAAGDTVEVYGTGGEIREFIYVTDVVEGMLHALEHGTHKEAYNLGTGGATAVTIAALSLTILDLMGIEKKIEFSHAIDAGDNARWSDTGRMTALGWRHKTGLKEGLQRTIEWRLGQ